MPHRKRKSRTFAPGEFYHIYNRGVEKRNIFLSPSDYRRFLFSMSAFQWEDSPGHVGRSFETNQHSGQHSMLAKEGTKLVNVVCYCLMPNHFHFLLEELADAGISRYMQRLGNSYTKYFNIKYNRHGHLFGSGFHAVHVDNNNYLLYLTRYIHLNPSELKQYRNRLLEYPWSSLRAYVLGDRKSYPVIAADIILEQFSPAEYKDYIEHDSLKDAIEESYLIDSQAHPRIWPTFDVGREER